VRDITFSCDAPSCGKSQSGDRGWLSLSDDPAFVEATYPPPTYKWDFCTRKCLLEWAQACIDFPGYFGSYNHRRWEEKNEVTDRLV
jgi:hypothetical protein